MQQPLWVYLLAPAATLVAGLIGVVAAFLVGRYQGRAQTQHDERVCAWWWRYDGVLSL